MRNLKPEVVLDALSFWNRALASPHGIKIASSRPWYFCSILYATRQQYGTEEMRRLKISFDETTVWIVPK